MSWSSSSGGGPSSPCRPPAHRNLRAVMHKPRQRKLGRSSFRGWAGCVQRGSDVATDRRIILAKKALVNAETELGEKHFPGVGPEPGAAPPAQTVLLATNHETVEVKLAPIECDLEQF